MNARARRTLMNARARRTLMNARARRTRAFAIIRYKNYIVRKLRVPDIYYIYIYNIYNRTYLSGLTVLVHVGGIV